MADRIGRADYELRGDQSGLVKDLTDAEKKIKGSGDRVEKSAAGTGVAFKAAAATAALGFGLMTKGALQMEGAQGKFMAATGKSREEAVAFSKDMNGLVGTAATVGKSFDSIVDAGVAVSQQFGVEGDEARDLTGDLLAFSKVTGQDAAGAAFALEDALSAYGLEAKDAAGIMDILVASNQKFGTDAGPATIGVLQSMAPALQAMGADMSDGIALLNAFEVAGVDASAAQRGLNSAITNLPEGQTLEGFMQHLQDLKNKGIDPTSEAVDVFGNKAGAALALTIKPGGNALDDFRVSAEEAAGSVDQAAEDMLTTTDKLQMFADKAGAALRGLGQDLGPLLSGMGGVASLAAALPSNLTKPLTDGLKSTWTKVAASGPVQAAIAAAGAVVSPIYSAGMKVAEAVGSTLSTMWLGFKSLAGKALGLAIAAAGAAAGLVYAAGTKVVEVLTPILSSAWTKMGSPGAGPIAAAGGAGRLAGAAMGAGIVIGLAAAAPTIDAEAKKLGNETGRGFFGMFGDETKGLAHGTVFDSFFDIIHTNIARLESMDPFASAQGRWAAQLQAWATENSVYWDLAGEKGIARSFIDAIERGLDPEAAYHAAIAAGDATGEGYMDSLAAHIASERADFVAVGTSAAAAADEGFVDGLAAGQDAMAARWVAMGEFYRNRSNAAFLKAGYDLGVAVPTGIGKGAMEESRQVVDAMGNLLDILENGLTPGQQRAEVMGAKWIKNFNKGIDSEIPGARDASFRVGVEGLQALSTGAIGNEESKRIGQIAAGLYADGWDSRQVIVALATQGVGEESLRALAKVAGWDDAAIDDALAYVDGLESKGGAAGDAGEYLAGEARDATGNVDFWQSGSGAGSRWATAFGQGISTKSWFITTKIDNLLKLNSPPKIAPRLDKQGIAAGAFWAEKFGIGVGGRLDGIIGGIVSKVRPAFRLDGSPDFGGGATMSGMAPNVRVDVGGITIPITVQGGGDPAAIGASVADKVREVLDDVFDIADRGVGLRWSEA